MLLLWVLISGLVAGIVTLCITMRDLKIGEMLSACSESDSFRNKIARDVSD